MPGLYQAVMNQPFNVFPGFAFIRNTDPFVTWPTIVTAGMPWIKTDADSGWTEIEGIFVRNEANDAWVQGALGTGGEGGEGAFRLKEAPRTTKTANYTAAHADEIIMVDPTAGAVTISLPPAADVPGVTYFIINLNGTNDVTVEPDGVEEIGGGSNRILNNSQEATLIVSDGVDKWLILARPGTGAEPEGAAGGDLNGTYPNPTIKDDVALGGDPTTTTQPDGTDNTTIATTGFVQNAIDLVKNGVSAAFDTLAEIATELGLKAPLASPALTGTPTVPTASPGTNNTQAASTAYVDAAVAAVTALPAQVSTQSGTSYTFVLGDANDYVRFTNAAAVAATIPANGSVAYPIGTELHVVQAGVGQVTLVADTGVTLNTPETLLTMDQFSVITAKKVATNEWDVFGRLETA